MKRCNLYGLLLWLPLLSAAISNAEEKPNLVLKTGLEIDADRDSVPDHWSVPKPSDYPAGWRVGASKALFGRSTVARTGEYSIMYCIPSPNLPSVAAADWWDYAAWERVIHATSGRWAVAFKTDDFPVKEYHLHRVRCYVKAENVLNLHIKFIATFVYPRRKKPAIRCKAPQ